MGRAQQIIQVLNDGEFHSGETLAQQLNISRAAVWKSVHALQEQGIAVQAVRGRGYRLAEPREFLDRDRIIAALPDSTRAWLNGIEIHPSIDSTNTYLMNSAGGSLVSGVACLAESQSAGRGRRGRSWVSPFAANLYLSLLWRFAMGPSLLTGLSLAVGIAAARAVNGFGVSEIGLKWPNDLLWRGRKLGGILLEFGGESTGPCHVVAGIGLNVAMPEPLRDAIDQPWVDLRTILGPGQVSRNLLAARVLGELVRTFSVFEHGGFAAFREEWQHFDVVAGKAITLQLPAETITGMAQGVDESGALCLLTSAGPRRCLAGEVSLRLAQ